MRQLWIKDKKYEWLNEAEQMTGASIMHANVENDVLQAALLFKNGLRGTLVEDDVERISLVGLTDGKSFTAGFCPGELDPAQTYRLP